jgi:hypothetical protein
VDAFDFEAELLVHLEVPRLETRRSEENPSSGLEGGMKRREGSSELAGLVVRSRELGEPVAEVHDDGDGEGGTVARQAGENVHDGVGVEAEAVKGGRVVLLESGETLGLEPKWAKKSG